MLTRKLPTRLDRPHTAPAHEPLSKLLSERDYRLDTRSHLFPWQPFDVDGVPAVPAALLTLLQSLAPLLDL